MAVNKAKYTIEIDGIQQAQQELQATSDSMGNLVEGLEQGATQADKTFDEITQGAANSNAELEKVNKTLDDIVDPSKAKAVADFSKGLAGGFQLSSQAAAVFGDESEEAFNKAQESALRYLAQAKAIEDLGKGLIALNNGFLKSAVTSFKQSGVAAKLFGTTTRAAVAATGIGILLILLGTLIGYWDDIKKGALSAFGSVKDNVADTESGLRKFLEVLFFIPLTFIRINKGIAEFALKFDFVQKIIQKVTEKFNLLKNAIIALLTRLGILDDAETKRAKKREKEAETQLENFEKLKKARELEIRELAALGAKEDEIAKAKLKLIQDELQARQALIASRRALNKEIQQEELDQIKELEIAILETQNTIAKIEADRAAEKKKQLGDVAAAELEAFKKLENARANEIRRLQLEGESEANIAKRKGEFIKEETAIRERLAETRRKLGQKSTQEEIDALEASKLALGETFKELLAIYDKAQTQLEPISPIDPEETARRIIQERELLLRKLTAEAILEGKSAKEVSDIRRKFNTETVEALRKDALEETLIFKELAASLVEGIEEEVVIPLKDLIMTIAVAATDALASIFDFFATISDNKIKELEARLSILNEQQQANATVREQIEKDLANASGERKKQLINQLREVEREERRIANEQANLEKKKLAEEEKANRRRKFIETQKAIIGASQAVIQALAAPFPLNIILPSLIGISAGAQVATIQNTSFDEGGFTGDGMMGDPNVQGRQIAGVVHDNEYVAPTSQIKKMPALFDYLERDRKGFATGGFTSTPTPTGTGSGQLLDASAIEAILSGIRLSVSVDQIEKVQKSNTTVEQKSSL
jgi:hypothetical protein